MRRGFRAAAAAPWMLCILLAGCASAPPVAPQKQEAPVKQREEARSWAGRLAMTLVDATGTPDPTQSFSASFQLDGTARAGSLSLFTPVGSTLAVLTWQPGRAELESDGKARPFGSLDDLVTAATGSRIPVAALFDWLRGRPTPVPGWKPDLSRLADGRISAHRSDPQPEADLRVVLER